MDPLEFFCCISALLTVSTKLRQPTGQRHSNIRMQQKNQSGQSYSYNLRKVWYHQIWIQTYLGFIVLILKEITRKLYKPDCSFESPVVVCRAEFYVIFLYCHKENSSSVHSMVSYWAVTNVTLDPLIKKKIEKYILCKFGQKQ